MRKSSVVKLAREHNVIRDSNSRIHKQQGRSDAHTPRYMAQDTEGMAWNRPICSYGDRTIADIGFDNAHCIDGLESNQDRRDVGRKEFFRKDVSCVVLEQLSRYFLPSDSV